MLDLYDSSVLLHRAVTTLPFLPPNHLAAFETYVRALSSTTTNPYAAFHSSLLAAQSTIDAILTALTRPPRIISQITNVKRTIERNHSSLSRSTRWPLGLLDDTRQRINEEREERVRQGQAEVDNLSRELRYTQQTVAAELAGWQDMHERMGRRAIRDLAKSMVVVEKMRLEGMRRALRKLREVQADGTNKAQHESNNAAEDHIGGFSSLSPPITLAGLEMANREAAGDNGTTAAAADLGPSAESSRVPASSSAPEPTPVASVGALKVLGQSSSGGQPILVATEQSRALKDSLMGVEEENWEGDILSGQGT